jgi:hypothetical protein
MREKPSIQIDGFFFSEGAISMVQPNSQSDGIIILREQCA